MSLPTISDLVMYVNKAITGNDWNTNWQKVVNWLTSGSTDIKVKNLEVSNTGGIVNNGTLTQNGDVSIENGNLNVSGSVTAQSFIGDGSALTGIVSSAIVSYTPFAVNSGTTIYSGQDDTGVADLITYNGNVLSFKVGEGTHQRKLVATTAKGVTFELDELLDLDLSAQDDGTFIICVKKGQQRPELRGKLYCQPNQPSGNNSDLWLNTAREGLVCYEKISGSWNNEYEGVPIGEVTKSAGQITEVKTYLFNQNGYSVNYNTPKEEYQVVGVTKYWATHLISGSKDTVYETKNNIYGVFVEGVLGSGDGGWTLWVSKDNTNWQRLNKFENNDAGHAGVFTVLNTDMYWKVTNERGSGGVNIQYAPLYEETTQR